jgi:hypothetical protein
MKNEIEQQIFKKMKAKDFGESMCNETKLSVLKWTIQQLRIHDVSGSVCDNCGEGKPAVCAKCYEIESNFRESY